MATVNATQCRKDFFAILESAVNNDERYTITTKNGNAVLISEEAWDGLMETLYILSDPEMLDSIKKAEAEYPDGFVGWRECRKDIT
ncbi:MAG: type II toxin-antitoxin system Phd/YefM family antitoxin [Candidatus Methanoplasma sp.]|jgi:prevent-host-death family protein|nr:type II toxin-antitoxin system Phd/YefM family antitoxin [Candidatus Methanoplasma sp.]